MDRGKNLPTKSSKVKPLGFAGDFIALGSKQGRPELADVKKPSATSGGSSKSSPSPVPTGNSAVILILYCFFVIFKFC